VHKFILVIFAFLEDKINKAINDDDPETEAILSGVIAAVLMTPWIKNFRFWMGNMSHITLLLINLIVIPPIDLLQEITGRGWSDTGPMLMIPSPSDVPLSM